MAAFTSSIRSSLLSSPKLSNAPHLSGSVPGHRMVLTVRRRSLDSRVSTSATPVMEEMPWKPESRVSMIVEVDLRNRSYPIYIGSGLLDEPDLLQRHVHRKRVLVVTNTTIAPLYLDKVVKALTHGNLNILVESMILPDGEAYKNMETLMKVFDKAIECRMDRRCTFVALGGGIIGDMCGFAAAAFLRGVNFIQIPTTLMAQVDSSVGGIAGISSKEAAPHLLAFKLSSAVMCAAATATMLVVSKIQPSQLAEEKRNAE